MGRGESELTKNIHLSSFAVASTDTAPAAGCRMPFRCVPSTRRSSIPPTLWQSGGTNHELSSHCTASQQPANLLSINIQISSFYFSVSFVRHRSMWSFSFQRQRSNTKNFCCFLLFFNFDCDSNVTGYQVSNRRTRRLRKIQGLNLGLENLMKAHFSPSN